MDMSGLLAKIDADPPGHWQGLRKIKFTISLSDSKKKLLKLLKQCPCYQVGRAGSSSSSSSSSAPSSSVQEQLQEQSEGCRPPNALLKK